MLWFSVLNKEKAKSNYHSRSPILNVEACFHTLDEKCSVEKKNVELSTGSSKCFCLCFTALWLFSKIPSPCQIRQSILTKSFLFRRMSERPRHFDRLSTRATKSGSLSNIYSIWTKLRFKKQTLSFKNANCSGNAIKRFCQIQLYFTKNSQNSSQSTAGNSCIRADAKSIHFVCSFQSNKSKTNWYWGPVFFVLQSSKEDRTVTDNYTMF